MSTVQGDECQSNNLNNLFIDSVRLPVDNSMRIVFTGYFNGFNVEIRSVDETALLYHMGCFGKGSTSKSKPVAVQKNPLIMRKRQFVKRNYWYKEFGEQKTSIESDQFLKDTELISAKIKSDSAILDSKDVIDLISSDENNSENEEEYVINDKEFFQSHDKQDIIVIVPNSDSEDDDYFAKLKPKCCLNKVNIHEKLILTLQEAFFLLYGLGSLQIVNMDNNLLTIEKCWDLFTLTDKLFIPKYIVYHYFRSKGYIVKPGIKFGGDYLLYKDGPGINHAEFIAMIKSKEIECYSQNWIQLLGHIRMATTTVKEIIIAEVIEPQEAKVTMPEDLSKFTVREVLLTRKIPVVINENDV